MKKNRITIIIILIAIALAAIVFWFFNMHIKHLEEEMQPVIIDLIKK